MIVVLGRRCRPVCCECCVVLCCVGHAAAAPPGPATCCPSTGPCSAGDVSHDRQCVLLGCPASGSLVEGLAEALTLPSAFHQEEGDWRP